MKKAEYDADFASIEIVAKKRMGKKLLTKSDRKIGFLCKSFQPITFSELTFCIFFNRFKLGVTFAFYDTKIKFCKKKFGCCSY
jgi:hypothetical protein